MGYVLPGKKNGPQMKQIQRMEGNTPSVGGTEGKVKNAMKRFHKRRTRRRTEPLIAVRLRTRLPPTLEPWRDEDGAALFSSAKQSLGRKGGSAFAQGYGVTLFSSAKQSLGRKGDREEGGGEEPGGALEAGVVMGAEEAGGEGDGGEDSIEEGPEVSGDVGAAVGGAAAAEPDKEGDPANEGNDPLLGGEGLPEAEIPTGGDAGEEAEGGEARSGGPEGTEVISFTEEGVGEVGEGGEEEEGQPGDPGAEVAAAEEAEDGQGGEIADEVGEVAVEGDGGDDAPELPVLANGFAADESALGEPGNLSLGDKESDKERRDSEGGTELGRLERELERAGRPVGIALPKKGDLLAQPVRVGGGDPEGEACGGFGVGFAVLGGVNPVGASGGEDGEPGVVGLAGGRVGADGGAGFGQW